MGVLKLNTSREDSEESTLVSRKRDGGEERARVLSNARPVRTALLRALEENYEWKMLREKTREEE